MCAVIDAPATTRPRSPVEVEIGPPPKKPQVVPMATSSAKDKPRWATAAGVGDGMCHWYVNRGRTLCGIQHDVLNRSDFHKQAPCPNGNPPCSECTRKFNE